MRKANSKSLNDEQVAELEALAALPDDQIDLRDAPEQRDWHGAKRGLFYRPVKTQLTLRLDADVVDWFKTQVSEDGYQTRINKALREHVARQSKSTERGTTPLPLP